jgi:hypothetical protein
MLLASRLQEALMQILVIERKAVTISKPRSFVILAVNQDLVANTLNFCCYIQTVNKMTAPVSPSRQNPRNENKLKYQEYPVLLVELPFSSSVSSAASH